VKLAGRLGLSLGPCGGRRVRRLLAARGGSELPRQDPAPQYEFQVVNVYPEDLGASRRD